MQRETQPTEDGRSICGGTHLLVGVSLSEEEQWILLCCLKHVNKAKLRELCVLLEEKIQVSRDK